MVTQEERNIVILELILDAFEKYVLPLSFVSCQDLEPFKEEYGGGVN